MIIDKKIKAITLESIFAETLRCSCSSPDSQILLTQLNSWPYNRLKNSQLFYSLTDIKQTFANCLDETNLSKQNELEYLWYFFTVFFDLEDKFFFVEKLNAILDNTLFKKFYWPPKVEPPKIMDKTAEKIFKQKRAIWGKNKRTLHKIRKRKKGTLRLKYPSIVIMPRANSKLYTISDIAAAFANALNNSVVGLYPSLWQINATSEQTSTRPFFISDTLSSSDETIYNKIERQKNLYLDQHLATYFATFSSKDTLQKIYSSIRKLFVEELVQKEETIDTSFLRAILKTLITTFHEIKIPENLNALFQTDDNYLRHNRKDSEFSRYSKKQKRVFQNYTENFLKKNLNSSTIEKFIEKYYEAEPIVIQKRNNLNADYNGCDKKTDIDTILSYFPYILYTVIIAILSNENLSHNLLEKMIKIKSNYFSVQKEDINEDDYEYEDEQVSNNFNRDFYRVLDKVFVPKTSPQYLRSSICFQTYLFKQCIYTCLNTRTFEISKIHFFESIFLFIYSFSEKYIDCIESCDFSEETTLFLQSNSPELFFYIMELLFERTSVLNTLR